MPNLLEGDELEEKIRKTEQRIARRNDIERSKAVKDVKFHDSLPSKLVERIDNLEQRIFSLEQSKGAGNGAGKRRGRPKRVKQSEGTSGENI